MGTSCNTYSKKDSDLIISTNNLSIQNNSLLYSDYSRSSLQLPSNSQSNMPSQQNYISSSSSQSQQPNQSSLLQEEKQKQSFLSSSQQQFPSSSSQSMQQQTFQVQLKNQNLQQSNQGSYIQEYQTPEWNSNSHSQENQQQQQQQQQLQQQQQQILQNQRFKLNTNGDKFGPSIQLPRQISGQYYKYGFEEDLFYNLMIFEQNDDWDLNNNNPVNDSSILEKRSDIEIDKKKQYTSFKSSKETKISTNETKNMIEQSNEQTENSQTQRSILKKTKIRNKSLESNSYKMNQQKKSVAFTIPKNYDHKKNRSFK